MEDNLKMIENLVHEIEQISNQSPGKKKLQKIVYLLQEKGFDFHCDYKIHFYGPYSRDLEFYVQKLIWEGALDIVITPSAHLIKTTGQTEDSLETGAGSDPMGFKEAVQLFAKDTPSDLELLTTTLYAARYLKEKNEKNIIEAVIKIKGSKYDRQNIEAAIKRLENVGYHLYS